MHEQNYPLWVVMNMYLIITEVNCGAVDDDDSVCHGYYILIFFVSIYPLIRLVYRWLSHLFC